MSNQCIYFVEGQCEKKLLDALRQSPALVVPGKVIVYNVIQRLIPESRLYSIKPGTRVTLVFDTDKSETKYLKRNIELLRQYDSSFEIIYLSQVRNFEDEIVRSTDVIKAEHLTQSKSKSEFKSDFCKLKDSDCRQTLVRHHFDIQKIWVTGVPEDFSFFELNSSLIKMKM